MRTKQPEEEQRNQGIPLHGDADVSRKNHESIFVQIRKVRAKGRLRGGEGEQEAADLGGVQGYRAGSRIALEQRAALYQLIL